MIVPNGYNLGRDMLVERALEGSSWNGMSWVAEIEWREGLLEAGYKGSFPFVLWYLICDPYIHLGINHAIAQDGRVAILTVHRV